MTGAMKTLRSTAILVAALSVPATSLAVSPASAQTVIAVMNSGLRVLDPIVSSAAITNIHGFMIYDTLLGTDEKFNVRPQMAEKWEISPDGKIYTFTLRDGLKWHDGAPVTAEDCVASLRRWGAQDIMGQVLMGFVAEMKAINDKTFTIVLKQATDMVLPALAKLGTRTPFMMPKRLAETPPSQQVKEQIGSGPFRFVASEFQPGLKVVYEKNEAYVPRNEPSSWTAGGKVVKVNRVEWVAMPDPLTAANALINKEIDYIETLPYDLLPMFKDRSDTRTETLNQLGLWTYFRFNFTHPPFDNKLVRQAAMYAVGQEDLLEALVGNKEYYSTCVAVFGCGTPYESNYGQDIIVPSNPEKAKELLKQANYKGEPVIILHPTDNPQVSTQPVVIADALRKAGFTVEIQSMDWQTVTIRRANRNPPGKGGWAIHATNGPLVGITDPLRNQAVATNGPKAWFGWPDVPEIEKLRAEFAVTTDAAKLKELAARIQQLVIDEGVVVPMGQLVSPSVYSTQLSGVLKSPVAVFWNMESTRK
jgi:peptide/nickel transport system substrate-binding protein